ncbi:hypothetical protein THAOC_35886 [Thalassiosira oceanica]|uniref:Uncharacterized protein n=1 Tax=Thalassiosira oceanica TaxID=159749 RepID=K0RFY1_THAOC|nr:hypothetical protein THAOC_35886 [Thalassiosira oceanica]|eukprot:EJK45497.1 hypothetical protein THAOC_35886 [Thalassiosira oceanica]
MSDEEEKKKEERWQSRDYRELIKEKKLEKKPRRRKMASDELNISVHRRLLTSTLSRVPSVAPMKMPLSPRKKKDDNFHYRTQYDLPPNISAEDKYNHGKRLTPLLDYEVFQWAWFLVLMTLAIADRFAWNVWPRQTYSIGSGSAGSDRTVGYKPGPWSVVLYDVLARVSGRYSIICYNFILITRLESLEQLLTTPFVRKYLLNTSNIINANTRLHYWNGIGLCVMTILHIWSILFPCVTHGYSAVVVPGVFEWPLSERTPGKCSVSNEPGCWPGDANPGMTRSFSFCTHLQ